MDKYKFIYINLYYRVDRNTHILNELQNMNISKSNIIRIDANLNKQCGHIGCANSHIKVLQYAIDNNIEKIVVLEDDFMFIEQFEYVNKFFNYIETIDYDVILLAGGYHILDDTNVNQFMKKIIQCTTTSGYIVKKDYYKVLLDNFKEAIIIMEQELKNHILVNGIDSKMLYCTAIDQYWFSLQKKDMFYLANPQIGRQYGSYSDNMCSNEYQECKIINLLGKKIILKVSYIYNYGIKNKNTQNVLFTEDDIGIKTLTNNLCKCDPVIYCQKYLYDVDMNFICSENDIVEIIL